MLASLCNPSKYLPRVTLGIQQRGLKFTWKWKSVRANVSLLMCCANANQDTALLLHSSDAEKENADTWNLMCQTMCFYAIKKTTILTAPLVLHFW